MKDMRKTKAQLIEELEAERQKTAGVDVSGVERQLAVERVRVTAVDMRASSQVLLTQADGFMDGRSALKLFAGAKAPTTIGKHIDALEGEFDRFTSANR